MALVMRACVQGVVSELPGRRRVRMTLDLDEYRLLSVREVKNGVRPIVCDAWLRLYREAGNVDEGSPARPLQRRLLYSLLVAFSQWV